MPAVAEGTVVIEFSLEHKLFPASELKALSGIACFTIERENAELALLTCSNIEFSARTLCSRLSFSHSVSILLGNHASWDELMESAQSAGRLLSGKTFRVRAVTRDREMKHLVPSLERELGAAINHYGKVDINNAQVEFRVFLGRGSFLLTRLFCTVDRHALDSRSVSNRVFFSPISLSPRYAKGLLNLCAVSEGERVLDPFCGTGGIVMEAMLIGADTVGTDIDMAMARGTMANIRQMGIKGKCELLALDVSAVPSLGKFDAIVTDPPYGRSSYMNRERPESLYRRAMKAFAGCLKQGGRLGIVLPDIALLQAGNDFTLETCIKQRVHRSLTRNYMVFRKK